MKTPEQIAQYLLGKAEHFRVHTLDNVRLGPHSKLGASKTLADDVTKAASMLESMIPSTTDRAAELNAIANAVHTMTKDQLVEHIRGLI